LHGNSVRLEFEIGFSADVSAIVGRGKERFFGGLEVGVQDLLGECERAIGKDPSDKVKVLEQLRIWRCSRGEICGRWCRGSISSGR